MWAEDPVTTISSIDLPEIAEMEAKISALIEEQYRAKATPQRLEVPLTVLGVPFSAVTLKQTIERVEEMIASRRPHYVVTANVDFLVQSRADVELHRILLEADLVLCDGQPLVWVSRWLGKPLPERVAGSDLVPELIRLAASRGHRVFFLGGTANVAEQAVANMQRQYPTLNVCGHYSPPFKSLLEMDHEFIAEKIRAAKPDLLFVSLGCPKAEKWMFMHYRALGVPVAIGVGGTIDFLARRLKRAPLWMQRNGMEWLYRVVQEPRRLFSRYARDARSFGGTILQQLWRLQWHHPRSTDCVPASIDLAEPTWKRIRPPEILSGASIERDHRIWSSALGKHCLLELSHVRFIDSAGMGLLIELQRQLLRLDCYLILVAPGQPVLDAIRLMSLEHLFLVAADTLEARELIQARLQQRMRIPALSAHATLPLIWKGEITAANVEHFWTAAQAQLDSFADYSEAIPIDLSGVGFIDSTGVGLLLRARNYVAAKGGSLHYLHPSPAVQNVLRISRLESVLLAANGSPKPKLVRESLETLNQFRGQWPLLRARKAT